jgi:hypothetical protein
MTEKQPGKELFKSVDLGDRPNVERAIGRLAMNASLLHLVLERFAWAYWGLSINNGRTLTSDLPVTTLINKLKQTLAGC